MGSQRVRYDWTTFTSFPCLYPATSLLTNIPHNFKNSLPHLLCPQTLPRGQVHQQCWMARYIKVHLLCVRTKGQSIKTRITTAVFARQVNWHVRKWTLLGNPLVEARMTAINHISGKRARLFRYFFGTSYLYDVQRSQSSPCKSGLKNNLLPVASQALVQQK